MEKNVSILPFIQKLLSTIGNAHGAPETNGKIFEILFVLSIWYDLE